MNILRFLFSGRVVVVILSLVLVYAGVEKVNDPHMFSYVISQYRVLPSSFGDIVAIVLPFFEVNVGLLLLNRYTIRIALISSIFLYSLFLILLIHVRMRGLDIECGCFGVATSSESSVDIAIIRDVLLLCLTWVVFGQGLVKKRAYVCASIK